MTIDNFLVLANTGGGGVSLNTDIFEANVINLAILLVGLFIFGRKVLTNILGERRATIEAALKDAESRQQQAATALSAAKEQLAQAKAEATKIREDGVKSAANAKADIEAKTAADITRMREAASQDTNSERERAIAQLRQQVVEMAMAKSQERLASLLNENAQQQLVDRSISLVGGK
jgi:F-type H+-transporting ATPase subunit b